MWQGSNKFMFDFVLLVVVIAVCLVFYTGEKGQKNPLESSLNIMGEKLFAMVPDVAEKMKINELYDEFKERAIAGDVPPEQIESVAANILNVSNNGVTLTPEQAETILYPTFIPSEIEVKRMPDIEVQPAEHGTPVTIPSPERLLTAGERVEIMFKFNEQMIEAARKQTGSKGNMIGQFHYQAKNGLNIVMDTQLKAHIDTSEHKALYLELEQLEEQDLINWSENFTAELDSVLEMAKIEQKVLRVHLKEMQAFQNTENFGEPDSVCIITKFENIPITNVDSIRKHIDKQH